MTRRRPYFAPLRPLPALDAIEEPNHRTYQRPMLRLMNPRTGDQTTVIAGIGIECALFAQGWQLVEDEETK